MAVSDIELMAVHRFNEDSDFILCPAQEHDTFHESIVSDDVLCITVSLVFIV